MELEQPGRAAAHPRILAFEAMVDTIAAVPAGASRPLWSVMIPAYNCAQYLRETLASVLVQDPGADRMQIEVVDDCSSDDPKAVVNEVDPGRVEYYRQSQNVGTVRNFNTCLERSRGFLVHILHGDDAVRDGFYRVMEQPFDTYPQLGAAFCRYISMDAEGNWETIGELRARRSRDSRRLAGAHRPWSAAADSVHGRAQIRVRAARWLRSTAHAL